MSTSHATAQRRFLLLGGALFLLLGVLALAGRELYFKTPEITAVPPTAPAPTEPLTDRLVVVIVDVLRADFAFDPEVMPFLNRQKPRAAWGISRTGELTLTALAVQCLGTGANADVSMALTNLAGTATGRESFIELAYRQGRRVVLLGEENWEGQFGHHADRAEGWPMKGWYDVYESDAEIHAAALAEVEGDRSQLVVAHFYGSDHVGHSEGIGQGGYAEKLRDLDGKIAELAQRAGPNTTMVVISDHGVGEWGGHGGGEEEARDAPFSMWGPGIRPAPDLRVPQTAIAPTLAALLGTALPRHAEGRVMVEALALSPSEEVAWLERSRQQLAGLMAATAGEGEPAHQDAVARQVRTELSRGEVAAAAATSRQGWDDLRRQFEDLNGANPQLYLAGALALMVCLLALVFALIQPQRLLTRKPVGLLACLALCLVGAGCALVMPRGSPHLEPFLAFILVAASGALVWQVARSWEPGVPRLAGARLWVHGLGLVAGVLVGFYALQVSDREWVELVDTSLPYLGVVCMAQVVITRPGAPRLKAEKLLAEGMATMFLPVAALVVFGLLFPRSYKYSFKFFERFELFLALLVGFTIIRRGVWQQLKGWLPVLGFAGLLGGALALYYLVMGDTTPRRVPDTWWSLPAATLLAVGLTGYALVRARQAAPPGSAWLPAGMLLLLAMAIATRFVGQALIYPSLTVGVVLLVATTLASRGRQRAFLLYALSVLLLRVCYPDIAFLASGLVAASFLLLPGALPRLGPLSGPFVAALTLILLQMACSFLSGNTYSVSNVESLAFLGSQELNVPLAVVTIFFTVFVPWLLVFSTWRLLEPTHLLTARAAAHHGDHLRLKLMLAIMLVVFLQVAAVFLMFKEYAANYWFVFYGLGYFGFAVASALWALIGFAILSFRDPHWSQDPAT